jgi:photosystem II stability/assembly factor-like uncharacterized protein
MKTGVGRHALALSLVFAFTLALAATRAPAPVYLPQAINPELTGGMLVNGSHALLVWGSDGTILRSDDGLAWSHALTPVTGDLAGIASNKTGAVLVAVGSAGAILRSVDGGRSWKSSRNKITDTDLRAVVNTGENRIWIAAGTNGRILRSIDDGKHWTLVESQLSAAFQTLFVDPQTQAILIGGEKGLVGFSNDAGVNWQITALAMPDPATPVTGFHRFGKLLLATSALGRFLTSEDDAQSWDLMQASSSALFTGCAFDPLHQVIVMTGHNGDVLRSADGGRTWEGGEVTIDGRKHFLRAIRFDARSGSLVVVGQGGSVARSSDGGVLWSKASDDIAGEVRGLIADTARHRLIAFGSRGLIASSTDSAAHWSTARDSPDVSLRRSPPEQ